MSSVSGLSGLYNNPNVVSGLVSGLDTEGMIESLVDSYSTKINGFQQSSTLLSYQQDIFRGIIADLNAFTSKYTSYTSPETNLSSSAFFTSAVNYVSSGTYADKVSTSGTTDSTVTIDRVLQTATSSRVESSQLWKENTGSITADAVKLESDTLTGNMTGSMTFEVGSTSISIDFTSADFNDLPVDATAAEKAEALAKAITEKLDEQSVTINGTSYKGSECIAVDVSGGTLKFTEGSGLSAGNTVNIKSASDSITSVLGLNLGTYDGCDSISVGSGTALSAQTNVADQISGKDMTFTYNGVSRTVTIPTIEEDPAVAGGYLVNGVAVTGIDAVNDAIVSHLNTELAKCYGKDVFEVSNASDVSGELQLSFNMLNDNDGTSSTLAIVSAAGEALGLGSTATNFLDTTQSMSDILGDSFFSSSDTIAAIGDVTLNADEDGHVDSEGNAVYDFGDGYVRVDEDNNPILGKILTINDTEILVQEDDTLSAVFSKINSSDAGVNVSYSAMTGKIIMTSNTTGANSEITMEGDLAAAIFGTEDVYDDANVLVSKGTMSQEVGVNALVVATVNGSEVLLERTENAINIDGMTVTIKGTFNNEDANGDPITDLTDYEADKAAGNLTEVESITFEKTTDTDKIVDAIVAMVDDYNEMMSTLKKAFTTMTATDSSGNELKPYTDAEAAELSDDVLAKREEEIKAGLLFGDSTLRSLYTSLSSAFSSALNGSELSAMGIDTSFSFEDYSSNITVDKDKLTAMIETDIDRVKNAFTNSTEAGASTNGLMTNLKSRIDEYASLTGSAKGILVTKAGSELNSLSLLDNTLQTQIDKFTELIETWQDKLTDKVNTYQAQFSRLEVLMSEMNSQSSALAGLSG
ncbi:MAG: flagellar filament capping protein FliD [Eubacteriales bacterium]